MVTYKCLCIEDDQLGREAFENNINQINSHLASFEIKLNPKCVDFDIGLKLWKEDLNNHLPNYFIVFLDLHNNEIATRSMDSKIPPDKKVFSGIDLLKELLTQKKYYVIQETDYRSIENTRTNKVSKNLVLLTEQSHIFLDVASDLVLKIPALDIPHTYSKGISDITKALNSIAAKSNLDTATKAAFASAMATFNRLPDNRVNTKIVLNRNPYDISKVMYIKSENSSGNKKNSTLYFQDGTEVETRQDGSQLSTKNANLKKFILHLKNDYSKQIDEELSKSFSPVMFLYISKYLVNCNFLANVVITSSKIKYNIAGYNLDEISNTIASDTSGDLQVKIIQLKHHVLTKNYFNYKDK